jgi:hypothetical protein
MIKAGCGDEKADKGHWKGQDRDIGSNHRQVGAFYRQYHQLGIVDEGDLIIWDRSFRFHADGFKLTNVSMSMKNDPVSVKNAERFRKGSGSQAEAVSILLSLA